MCMSHLCYFLSTDRHETNLPLETYAHCAHQNFVKKEKKIGNCTKVITKIKKLDDIESMTKITKHKTVSNSVIYCFTYQQRSQASMQN